jgi:hypothetical protein
MAEIEYYDLVADIGGEEQGDMSPLPMNIV